MDSQAFDDLARSFAGSRSRRQFLKALVWSAMGSFFMRNGAAQAYAPPGPVGPGVLTPVAFLPLISVTCTAPSACGNRQYCAADQSCLCLKSAEGPILCGKIPSSCAAQLCTTSADCANLGPGYFCDSPNSGCCTDPPAELTRCIAPCAPCPAERACGASCCQPGETCVDGACVPPDACGTDQPTSASLQAAYAALASGATDVALSPAGCSRFRVTVVNPQLTREELIVAGKTAFISENTPTEFTEQEDADQDSFFEWRSTIQIDAAGDPTNMVTTEHAPSTGAVIRRRTYARQGQAVHVRVEEADDAGVLQVVEDYSAALQQGTAAAPASDWFPAPGPAAQSQACTADQTAVLENRVFGAMADLMGCMRLHGQKDVLNRLKALPYPKRMPLFTCNPNPAPGPNGELPWATTYWYTKSKVLEIDITTATVGGRNFFDQNESTQTAIVGHELMHHPDIFGPHYPGIELLPRYREMDRNYACTDLCFGWQPPTRCSCARCLATNKCDKRCQQLPDCDEKLSFMCPCINGPNFMKKFPTCAECLSACPSGLGCFTTQFCLVDHVGCSGSRTCP
jgi:hypothetical protein